MDSLLASYASSDEDDDRQQPSPPQPQFSEYPTRSESVAEEDELEDRVFAPKTISIRGDIFKFLPPPKSSLANSLPSPRSLALPTPQSESEKHEQALENSKSKPVSTSLFSILPQPKMSSSSSAASKRVVQFRPPTTYSAADDDEDDEDDADVGEIMRQKKNQSVPTFSTAAFLSSMPAPKHSATLGSASSAMGSSRRHILETDNKATNGGIVQPELADPPASSSDGYPIDHPCEMNYDYSTLSSENATHPDYNYYATHPHSGDTVSNPQVGDAGYQFSEAYGCSNDYANYGGYGVVGNASESASETHVASYGVDYSHGNAESLGISNYGGSYGEFDTSYVAALPETSGVPDSALQVLGKRGRKDAPSEIIEVKQDELLKNRPRQDQLKMTGIAFGPSYQPASAKGKPSKLHKRKHQIGSLFFDMKQKEMELAERRSRGLMTKAQTQGKYGW